MTIFARICLCILYQLWQKYYAIGQIFIVINGQKLNSTLVIWSHWSQPTCHFIAPIWTCFTASLSFYYPCILDLSLSHPTSSLSLSLSTSPHSHFQSICLSMHASMSFPLNYSLRPPFYLSQNTHSVPSLHSSIAMAKFQLWLSVFLPICHQFLSPQSHSPIYSIFLSVSPHHKTNRFCYQLLSVRVYSLSTYISSSLSLVPVAISVCI